MKFKREDIGLYFAFALLAGGIGLLAGAILANYIDKKLREDQEEDEEYGEESEYYRKMAEEHFNIIKRQERYAVEKVQPEIKKERPKKERENKSGMTPEELDEFQKTYQPSQMQVEMLINGLMTPEELKGVLELEEQANAEDEVYNYAKQYHEDNVEQVKTNAEKEAVLSDLEYDLETLGIINDRYEVHLKPPQNLEELSLKQLRWDIEDNSFYISYRGKSIIYNLDEGFGHDAWEVIEPYFLEGIDLAYIVDQTLPRCYEVRTLAEMGEDEPAFGDNDDSV